MFDILNNIILWWHWLVFGLLLLLLEILTGTFFVLTLAIGALIVGIISFLITLSFNSELTLWIIFSLIGIAIWYSFMKNKKTPEVGQSNYRFNTLGSVTKKIKPYKRGQVVFDKPVLGNSSWVAISDKELEVGQRVKIVEVNGQLIKVERRNDVK